MEGGNTAKVTGTVSYRERILLRPGSQLEISLQDVSRADAPAKVIAQLEKTDPGQVPIHFELDFDPSEIDERMSYSLRARILDADGRLLFTSDTHTPVLTRGAGSKVEMMLVAVDRSAADQVAGMELTGMFRYLADAALFQDCSTGKSWPVEMSGEYIELERAYLNSGIEAGQPLRVELRGRYLERPGMEENTREVKLIVDSFISVSDKQECVPTEHAELLNTYWKLVELDGNPVVHHGDNREAHFVLQSEEQRVQGHGSCNNFFGSYQHDGESLSFDGMGVSMKACIEGMDTEQAFMQALEKTNRGVVSGQFLSLYQGETLLARLEAVYF